MSANVKSPGPGNIVQKRRVVPNLYPWVMLSANTKNRCSVPWNRFQKIKALSSIPFYLPFPEKNKNNKNNNNNNNNNKTNLVREIKGRQAEHPRAQRGLKDVWSSTQNEEHVLR